MTPPRVVLGIGLLVLALTGAAALVLFHTRSRLIADWRELVIRSETEGIRLDGRPVVGLAWPSGMVLNVHDAGASLPTSDDFVLRTAGLTLEGPAFAPDRFNVRLDQPLTASTGRRRFQAGGHGIVVTVTGSGRVELGAEALHVATGAAPDEIATFQALTAACEPAAGRAFLSGHFRRLVLPLAGWPLAERTLADATFAVTSTGTRTSPVLAITLATAAWLGVAVRASGTLSAPGGRLAGSLSVTIDRGWRDAINRAARDGAITRSEAQAATGLLGLLDHGGEAPELPLAIDDGRVTLAGLLLTRLPELPALASPPTALP